jgi:competence protein ComEC
VFPPDHLVHHASGRPLLLEGVLVRQPEVRAAFTRLVFEARTLRTSGGAVGTQGRADLWVSGRMPDLRVGDILLAEVRLKIPRLFGNPGEVDRGSRSFLEGRYVRGSVRDGRHLFQLGVAEGYRFERFVQDLRSDLAAFFEKEPDPEARGLLRAWFLGDRSGLTDTLAEAFRSSGLAHLLAISGLHVGLVGLFTYRGLKSLLKRSVTILLRFSVEKIAILGGLPIVLAYVLLVGAPMTAVRAAAMFTLFVGSLLLDRARAVWNSLALAGLVILLWDPAALFSVSFLLSFTAVAALLAAATAWKPVPPAGPSAEPGTVEWFWSRARAWASKLFIATLTATVATAPLTAFAFNRITPLAVFANLLVVPVVGWLVIPFGLVTAVMALACPPAAVPLLRVTSAGAKCVASAAEAFAQIPFASLRVGTPSFLEMAMCYLAFFAWIGAGKSPWRKRVVWASLIVFGFSVASSILQDRSDPHLAITFLAVGQGDSMLVEFPGGKRMIVDGGLARKGYQDAGRSIVSPFLGQRRICRIDYMVVSHGQADHYGGLAFLASDLDIGELWIGPERGCEGEGYLEFLNLCRANGIRTRRLCRGMGSFSVNGVEVEILNPPRTEKKEKQGSAACAGGINDHSLVMRLTLGRVSVLLTGDIEEQAEKDLLVDSNRLEAILLKVPHHGSPSSSRETFLDAVAPGMAVVSAGYRNHFGFPSEEVVRRYRDRGIPLYRTDLDGAVRFETDGRTVWMETYRDEGR